MGGSTREVTFTYLVNNDSTDKPSLGLRSLAKRIIIIALLMIIATIVVALLIPQGVKAVPLEANYAVGEKMIYHTSSTGTFEVSSLDLPSALSRLLPKDLSSDSTHSIEVVAFDSESYTLNHSTFMMLNNKPIAISMTEKLNKIGYSTYMLNFVNTQNGVPNTNALSNLYITPLLNQEEIIVDDRAIVSFPSINPDVSVTGDVTLTFKGIEDITVPAGTYKVFRVDMTSNNLHMEYNPAVSLSRDLLATLNLNLNYQVYLEYGTMRHIKSVMQQTMTFESDMIDYEMQFSMEMILSQHVKQN